MAKQGSLAALKARVAGGKRLPKGLLEQLELDTRSGAQALARIIKSQQAANRAEGQRLRNMLRFEGELHQQGITLIAGVDEAGMGPMAGPVVASACILPQGYKLKGLDDSKKILDEAEREDLAARLKKSAVAWACGWASVDEIDTINIYHAGLLAMRRAVEGLSQVPQFCLVDARRIPLITIKQRGIIKGDALSLSIAAASVIAKTTRDAHMRELDAKYPGYGFAIHKGYSTPDHQAALDTLGALPIHRRSFAPVRKALGLLPTQDGLFPAPAELARSRAQSKGKQCAKAVNQARSP